MTEAEALSVEALRKVARSDCSLFFRGRRYGIELAHVAKVRGAMKRGGLLHMERENAR
jgi:hypothetical protein